MKSFLSFGLILAFSCVVRAEPPRPFVLEEQPKDPKAIKIVLISGPPSAKAGEHEYDAGCRVLADLLRQTPGIFPVLVRDGWPTKAETFVDAKAIVCFFDGGDSHAFLKGDRFPQIQKLMEAGVGMVQFHQCVDYPKDAGVRARDWIGGVFEKGHSQRAHWVADFASFPDHAVCRGVTPFKIDDGWLYKLRFAPTMKGVTPLLRTTNPKVPVAAKADPSESVVSWLHERPGGGRSFAFTGCHLHSSWGIAGYRQLLVNGILWTARIDIPTAGAPTRLDAADLPSYLETRAKK